MPPSNSDALETIDYLQAIAETSRSGQISRSAGWTILAAGVLFGSQALIVWAQFVSLLPPYESLTITTSAVAVAGFLAVLVWHLSQSRKARSDAGDAAQLISESFAGAGFAIACIAIIFGASASRANDWEIWALFPAVMCAIQGVAWYIVAAVKQRFWLRATGFCWFATGIGLSCLVGQPAYLLLLGLALLVLLALPGFYFLQQSKH